ncbi:MAG: hypothetical protein KAX37_11650, partial [Opitutaceae bacterium]|nr:hypothetical protein [Opitutaceae bacterium]
MKLLSKLPVVLLCVLALLPGILVRAQTTKDQTFSTSTVQAKEVQFLVKLLEEVHYNRDAVKPGDYGEIVQDYMTELDGARMFFLESDKDAFTKTN